MSAAARLAVQEDRQTHGHEVRVARMARRIARRLGLSPARVTLVGQAALLHDIGKIEVPLALIRKPGRLMDDERHVMQRHPYAGYRLLRRSGVPMDVALVVLQHHERLDGSGYPNGESGDAISLEARIVAVADVVDAITSERSYREALALDVAFDELRNGRGRLYDTRVVDACMGLLLEDPQGRESAYDTADDDGPGFA